MPIEKAINQIAVMLNKHMQTLLPNSNDAENRVIEAMQYSLFSDGKRIRPFLVINTANMFEVNITSALNVASALECIHTYSLIHDDLPAMDNDDMRRGRPSCHKQFDEATAILAGDGLLTYAFEILSDDVTHKSPNVRCELVKALSKASGFHGMVGGQMLDIEGKADDLSSIMRMQRLKTGALFSFGCEAGAILGQETLQMRENLRMYAHDLGLIFQITDDLLDVESTTEKLGKTVGKDVKDGKKTLVSLMGIEQAREQLKRLAEQAIQHLHFFGKEADLLRELVAYIVSRKK